MKPRNSVAVLPTTVRLATVLAFMLVSTVAFAGYPLHMESTIWFKENSAALERDSVIELERLVCALHGGRVRYLNLSAHAAKGERNPGNLAMGRALAVRAWLMASPAVYDYTAIANGSDEQPWRSNATAEGRAFNRQVALEMNFVEQPIDPNNPACGPRKKFDSVR
jgi:hypothetical protein